jgi:hypothetical protein
MAKIKTTIDADYNFHEATDTFAAAAVIRDARAIFGERLKIEWDGVTFAIDGLDEVGENRLGADLFARVQWAVERLADAGDRPGVTIDIKAGTVTYSEGF